jgi:hypothetical protein
MLESRNIITTLSGEALRKSTAGDNHRRVYSDLCCGASLWMNFYGDFSNGYYYTVGYANDIAILMNGKFPHYVRGVTYTRNSGHSPGVMQ